MFVGNPLNSFVLFDNTTQRELTTMNNNGKKRALLDESKKYAFFLRIERVCVGRLCFNPPSRVARLAGEPCLHVNRALVALGQLVGEPVCLIWITVHMFDRQMKKYTMPTFNDLLLYGG